MGASSSKMDDDDKALQLCCERKKFVKQALDRRCSFAASHVSYVHSLKNTGTTLRKFLEPEAPIESSLDTSTNATPEQPLDKTLSQFSLSSSVSRCNDATETFSPTPSPPSSNPTQNYVKYLTWRRTMSSQSYSSTNPPGANSKADVDDVTNNLFGNFCMIPGSHASTLDRLYAWERKLYDKVKKSWFGYQTKL
ncbi:hypothetical protein JHK87_004118 [Glycine soja]|nr:hypothetical protein JHK87_004118 [Glycine soja]